MWHGLSGWLLGGHKKEYLGALYGLFLLRTFGVNLFLALCFPFYNLTYLVLGVTLDIIEGILLHYID